MSHGDKKEPPCDCPHCTMGRIAFSQEAERNAPLLGVGDLFYPGSDLNPPAQNAPSIVRLQ